MTMQLVTGNYAAGHSMSLAGEANRAARGVVCGIYPITPQTHIVENISRLVANGKLHCEFVSVESEFSAASVALGAAMAGSRAYTASASQGLMLMAEVLFNIAGMRVPLVMTCANRALAALRRVYQPQAFNLGVNIGAGAGAGHT